MNAPRELNIGAVAQRAGVTVRTLHHYDEVGLLKPSGRTEAGYRRYSPSDLERLQGILVYRELGFRLDEIHQLMADDADPVAHLRRQHALLLERRGRLDETVSAIEAILEAKRMGVSLTPEEQFELFGGFNADEHAADAEARWGTSDAFRESARRTARYSKEDWQRIMGDAQSVVLRVVEAMNAGKPTDSIEAMDAAEAHRQQITSAFYECSYPIHVGLADGYVADPRFTATYEKIAPGLAQYLSEAIKANAARHGYGAGGGS
jgi:DNA-binding transcriptional MerR regulator